jgi:hypothetical protein
MKKSIIFVSGYARAGKSTFINYAESLGHGAESTSKILYEVATNILVQLFGFSQRKAESILADKTASFSWRCWWNTDDSYGNNSLSKVPHRSFLIKVAERILVPVFGRELFARQSVIRALRNDSALVFVETIGGDEFDASLVALDETVGRLPEAQQPKVFKVNVRSPQEERDADYRQLLPHGLEIWNYYTEGYSSDIRSLIQTIQEIHDDE